MNYDDEIKAWIFPSLPSGYELGLNNEEGMITNVEKIRLGSDSKFLLTKTPAQDTISTPSTLYGFSLFNS